MNKSDLIEAIAAAVGLSKADAKKALEAIVDNMTKTLVKGKKVTIVGFGSFTVRKRAARKGRNPQTGETIKIKATNVPSFKAGKSLKDAVNNVIKAKKKKK